MYAIVKSSLFDTLKSRRCILTVGYDANPELPGQFKSVLCLAKEKLSTGQKKPHVYKHKLVK